MSSHAEAIRVVLDWPICHFDEQAHDAAVFALDALLAENQLAAVFRRLLRDGDYSDLFGVEGHRTLRIDSALDLSEDEYLALKQAREALAGDAE